ncbi:MAG: SIMPL domain-containing protein, partial [Gemmatimonadales bacterium]|nr:SIMPL domain-containing protein [Gemmatimonadales bacterium]
MTLQITPLTLLLAACGGMQAGAQPQVAKGADRLHVYEVATGIAVQAAQQGFIEVSGTGSVSVESDLAHVSFAVETRRPSAAEAASGNATLMESVLGAIREAGLGSPRIETFGYQLRPEYTRADGNRPAEISSYVAA